MSNHAVSTESGAMAAEGHKSRRAALRALVGASALAIPAIGTGVSALGDPILAAIGPQCIIGTQISDILDVTRTRLPDHAARGSASRLSGRMPSTS